jgi:hypothetical protein
MHSTYFQYIYRFVPHILSIQTDSFRIFSVHGRFHSAFSQFSNRFILRIPSICADSFSLFRECTQIISNIQNGIIFFTAFKGILLQKTVCMCATGPKTHKKYSIIWLQLNKKILSAYLGEFEFIFENHLGYKSEDQERAFYEKINTSRKSRASVPLGKITDREINIMSSSSKAFKLLME